MSFPNPAMLPFFAAGGAISGSSFGLFYTILMQVGYNFYGKKVLEDLQGGMSLFDALQKVQKEIRPFSDAMMQAALDAMPDTIEKSIDAFSNIITTFTEERMKDLAQSWLLPQGTQVPTTIVTTQPAPSPTITPIPDPIVGTSPPPVEFPKTVVEQEKLVALSFTAMKLEENIDLKTRVYNITLSVLQHKARLRLYIITWEDLAKRYGTNYWQVTAYGDVLYKYRLAFKNKEGYWI